MYSIYNFEAVCCPMSHSNYFFLNSIWVSQEIGKMFWCSYLLKNFPASCDPHKEFSIVNEVEIDIFLLFLVLSMIQFSSI